MKNIKLLHWLITVSVRKSKITNRRPKEGASFVGLYEKPMLDLSIEFLKEAVRKKDRLAINFYIETFLLHARNIGDFLFLDQPFEDTIVAQDYLPAWKLKGKCSFYRSKKRQINKSVQHLSYSRIDYENRDKLNSSDCERIHEELSHAWKKFWSELPTEKKEWFKERQITNLELSSSGSTETSSPVQFLP